jgi:[ribosomal protein S5]-alanine N-acetyltransferase
MVEYLPDRIDGPRLLLRLPVLDDAGALFQRVARDPQVTKYLLWTPHPDVAATLTSLAATLWSLRQLGYRSRQV